MISEQIDSNEGTRRATLIRTLHYLITNIQKCESYYVLLLAHENTHNSVKGHERPYYFLFSFR